LAALAGKAVKETTYHLRHSAAWVVRLGDGTDESRRRTVVAIDDLWRFTGELFEADHVEHALMASGVAPDPEVLRAEWRTIVTSTFDEATLDVPADGAMQTGGRSGRHSEAFSYLIG